MPKRGPKLRTCPRCQWTFFPRKEKKYCPGCGVRLCLFLDSFGPDFPEKDFWIELNREGPWKYIEDWLEYRREAMKKLEAYMQLQQEEYESSLPSLKRIQ